jgi:tetratricopeptide (TPR) repeat protein
LYWLGKIQKSRAASTLQAMIETDPDSYRVHQLVAEGHEENTEYDKAIQGYQAALGKRPELAGLRYAIGNVYFKMRQYERAETWLAQELERNPHHGLAHYRLGAIYVDQGEADLALAHLRQALEAHPDLHDARLQSGRALAALERHGEAVAEFLKFAAAEPNNDRVHYLLANSYRKLGQMPQAQAEMQKYRELNRKRLETVQEDVRDVTDSLADP